MELSRIRKETRKGTPASTLLDPKIVWPAIGSAFVKLDPRTLIKNPVMLLEIVTVLTTVTFVRDLVTGSGQIGFEFQIVLWLWFTAVCEFRRGDRRRPRQGAGRCAAQSPRPRPSCSPEATGPTTSACPAPA